MTGPKKTVESLACTNCPHTDDEHPFVQTVAGMVPVKVNGSVCAKCSHRHSRQKVLAESEKRDAA